VELLKRIVLVRVTQTGWRKTGKLIRPDGVNWIEESEQAPKPEACNWGLLGESNLSKAKEFAKREGYKVLVMPDTEDVLEQARKLAP